MTGLAQVILTDKELRQIHEWYITYLLAGENSARDDALAERLEKFQGEVPRGRRPSPRGRSSRRPDRLHVQEQLPRAL